MPVTEKIFHAATSVICSRYKRENQLKSHAPKKARANGAQPAPVGVFTNRLKVVGENTNNGSEVLKV